jgi:CheY-like chemotaxis protein
MTHKLLLADDSITIQRVIELTFAEEDVNVLSVGDGKHAIDRIQTERPDIVLADVGMPEQDGYEVAAFVKGNPQLAHIPVLLLTGAFEPIDENRARTVGCDGVLVKPFEPQMVINRVKDLLAGKKPANANNATPEPPRPVVTPGQESYVPRAANQSDSLEEYFDRLDAAFANLNNEPAGSTAQAVAAPPAPPPPAIEATAPADVDSWDPDLTVAANQPPLRAPIPLVPPPPIPLVQTPTAVPLVQDEPAPAPRVAAPFEPLPFAPPPAPPAAPEPAISVATAPAVAAPATVPMSAPVSLAEAFATLLAAEHGQASAPFAFRQTAAPAPDFVDDIVRQVLNRLQQDDMRRAVLDAAERLVREEIDRIKRINR